MEEINKFRIINKLKKVYRFNTVEKRKESSAEHSWSTLILADLLINEIEQKIDRLKVYELLMYHDLHEIKAGDAVLHPNIKINEKERAEIERIAAKEISEELPQILGKKYEMLFEEYKEQKTIEAKFAKAVDQLDAELHELDYKQDWKGWTEEFLREKKEKYLKEFPKLIKLFNQLKDYERKEGYFDVK